MSNSETMRIPFYFISKKQHQASDKIMPRQVRMVSKAERIADEIIYLFETYSVIHSDNEPVSHVSHMVQCAMLAMPSSNDLPVIIGALLHDIGHLIKQEQPTEAKDKFGLVNEDNLGSTYLRTKGFSEHVCAIAEQQVAAKRFLVATDEVYKKNITSTSMQKVNRQGGPMSASEVAAFEKQIYFKDIINVGRWDEEARNPKANLLPVTWFRRLLWDHLYYRVS